MTADPRLTAVGRIVCWRPMVPLRLLLWLASLVGGFVWHYAEQLRQLEWNPGRPKWGLLVTFVWRGKL